MLAGVALPSVAAQVSSEFGVSVTLIKPGTSPNTGLCTSNTGVGMFGATVTVVCGTNTVVGLEAVGRGMPWKPVHGGAYRFLTRISSAAITGTVDSYTGADTSTTFRIVNSAGQEYVEMTVEW